MRTRIPRAGMTGLRRGAWVLIATMLATLGMASAAQARTFVTFSFDDGSSDQYAVREMLARHGMRATFYVNSGMIGSSSYYMTWDQLKALYADGHEIGGHTLEHTTPADQTPDQQREDVCQDRNNLLARGFAATSFAYSFGVDNLTEAIVQGCGYNSAQVAGGLRWGSTCERCPMAEALPPKNPYYLRSVEIRAGMTGAQLAGFVEETERAGGGWIVFPFNRVCQGCSRYEIAPAALDDLFARVKAMVAAGDAAVVTVQEAIGGQLQPPGDPEPGSGGGGGGGGGAGPGEFRMPEPPPGSGITTAGRDTIAPIIVSLRTSRKRFAVARGETALTAAVRRGTTLRYVLSEPGRVVFTVQRARPGRRAGGTCRKPSARLRGLPRCTLYTRVGGFSRTTDRLANRVKFSGRVGWAALRPGRYRITARAIDQAGNRSRSRSVRFTIVSRNR